MATDFNKKENEKRPSAIAPCHVQDNDSTEQDRKKRPHLRRLKSLRQLQLELSARVDGEDPRSRNAYGTIRPHVLLHIK